MQRETDSTAANVEYRVVTRVGALLVPRDAPRSLSDARAIADQHDRAWPSDGPHRVQSREVGRWLDV